MTASVSSEIVSGFGIAAALYLFVSPVVTMRRIVKDKTAGHFSPLPYLAQLLESSLWTLYASLQLAELRSVFINNTIAICFQIAYLTIFLCFPPAAKAQLSRLGTGVMLVAVLVAVAGVTMYAWAQGWSCEAFGARVWGIHKRANLALRGPIWAHPRLSGRINALDM